jgi:predicted protein tyrosine phosphatase
MDSIAPFEVSLCGIEDLFDHRKAGVSHVLSILDPDWPVPEAFGAFGEHVKLELRFHDVIGEYNAGAIAPGEEHVAHLLEFGRSLLADATSDGHLLVHCHAGVSRSTATMALILAQALPNAPGKLVFDEVLRIRPQAWPNLRLIEMGDAQLGREGELVCEVAKLYGSQLDRDPSLEAQMRFNGRGREIDLAASS